MHDELCNSNFLVCKSTPVWMNSLVLVKFDTKTVCYVKHLRTSFCNCNVTIGKTVHKIYIKFEISPNVAYGILITLIKYFSRIGYEASSTIMIMKTMPD